MTYQSVNFSVFPACAELQKFYNLFSWMFANKVLGRKMYCKTGYFGSCQPN